jgi:protein involved in polysaccharide export with SLBB domain
MPKSFLSTIVAVRRGALRPLAGFLAKPCLAIAAAILLLAVAGCETPQTAQAPLPPQPSPQNPATEQLLATLRQASASPVSTPTPVSPQAGANPPPAPASSTAQLPAALREQPGAAQTNSAASTASQINGGTNALVLQEGDAVQISFPGATSLNRTVSIRRDGKISLDMIGDIEAAGLTPNQLEKVLLEKYGPQLVVKEVTVSVVSSAFMIYVTGAVMRPGKVVSERPLTPLQAVIEAGIDTQRSNLRAVRIIRTDDRGNNERFKLNLKKIIDGKQFQPFTLRPLDIIVVPEKFTWF